MPLVNPKTGTTVDEIAEGIHRISTPVSEVPGGFTFNQFLIMDEEPLLFHTGPRKLFPVVKQAVETLVPASWIRWIAFSHVESDECGSLNEWLAAAPGARPVCSQVAAMVSVDDMADRPARGLADGEVLKLGQHMVKWIDAPHLPHGWECGYMMELTTSTLLCGDLFTQGGADLPAITKDDIVETSEIFRRQMDYFSHTTNADVLLDKLAEEEPEVLACMHGSTYQGDGGAMLRSLAKSFRKG